MSGECPTCSEHPVDCRCWRSEGKNLYYSHGKLFSQFDDLMKFRAEWPDMPCDVDEFKREMGLRVREIEMNMQMSGGTLTNLQAHAILRMSTDWILNINLHADADIPEGKV